MDTYILRQKLASAERIIEAELMSILKMAEFSEISLEVKSVGVREQDSARTVVTGVSVKITAAL